MADTTISELTRRNVPIDRGELDARAVDTVRVLTAEAVRRVGNGHPGTAMSPALTEHSRPVLGLHLTDRAAGLAEVARAAAEVRAAATQTDQAGARPAGRDR